MGDKLKELQAKIDAGLYKCPVLEVAEKVLQKNPNLITNVKELENETENKKSKRTRTTK